MYCICIHFYYIDLYSEKHVSMYNVHCKYIQFGPAATNSSPMSARNYIFTHSLSSK